MPASMVKPGEEHLWERAKKQAAKQGHDKDWPYVVSIFKKMREGTARKEKAKKHLAKSYIISLGQRLGRIPGQIPNLKSMERKLGLDKMPQPDNGRRLLLQMESVLTPAAVIKGLGFNLAKQADWTRFLTEQVQSSANEVVFRKAVLEKSQAECQEPAVRRIILQRSLLHWRECKPSAVRVMLPHQLKKSMDCDQQNPERFILAKTGPRGGKYHRRIPNSEGNGYRYIYKAEHYDKRDDRHISGEEAAGSYISENIMKCVMAAGKKGVVAKSLAGLVAKHGREPVIKALKTALDSGKLRLARGRLYSKNEET